MDHWANACRGWRILRINLSHRHANSRHHLQIVRVGIAIIQRATDYRAQFVFDVLKRYGNARFSRVADFGCGDGRVLRTLMGLVDAEQGLGVDIKQMDADSPPIRFQKSDFLRYCPKETYDLVISNQVFEHIYEPWLADYFNTLKCSCSPDGVILISTPNRWRPGNLLRRCVFLPPHMMCANPGVPPEEHTGHHRECSYRELRSILRAHFPASEWKIWIARPLPRRIGSIRHWLLSLVVYFSLWLVWYPLCISASHDHYAIMQRRSA